MDHGSSYYSKCFFGGMLACGLTHTAVNPLDVVKSNAPHLPFMSSFDVLVASKGTGAVWNGWVPTLAGYSVLGALRYGLYEVFKDFYSNVMGEEQAKAYKPLIWCMGAASAEFFADIALCPLEMVRVKMVVSPRGAFPSSFFPALSAMAANRAETGFPFRALVPIWSRQIPSTVIKFFFFEKIVLLFYSFTAPKDSYSKRTQLGVSFSSGFLAGVISAIVSHPTDSMFYQRRKANKGKSFRQIVSDVGAFNLFMKGLRGRVVIVGALSGFQWWIYDSVKTAFGLGTTGGT